MDKVAPLPGSFMIISLLGFFISTIYVSEFSASWALAFSTVFVLMFIASFISMAKGDPEVELKMDEKTFHKSFRK